MKQVNLFLITTFLTLFFLITNSCSQTIASKEDDTSVFAVFVGSTPCSYGTRPLPGIPVNADCEFIKWHLTLYQDPNKSTPTTYKLNCTYGLPKQGTSGFIGGGTKLEMEGKWKIVKSTKNNPVAIVYQLDTNQDQQPISFLKLDQNLLHLLDTDKNLMIGNAAWSYTLNRIGNN